MPQDATTGESGPSQLAVFFDGSCPICRREIGMYRARDTGGAMVWIDASVCATRDLPEGLDRTSALARFHVRRVDGAVVSGAAAFAEMWVYTPGFRWVGRLARLAAVQAVLEPAYRLFLRYRSRLQRATARLYRERA